MNTETLLFYFIENKTMDDEDRLNISRYNVRTVFLIRYSKKEETLEYNKFIENYKEKNIFLFKRMTRTSNAIIDNIIDYLLHKEMKIEVDLTKASSYHASKITAMSIRWGFDTFIQTGGYKLSMNTSRLYYDATSKDERRLLETMNLETQSYRDIIEYDEIKQTMVRSNVFKLLSRLCERGLLTKTVAERPEGYKGKQKRGYKMTEEQYLDFKAFNAFIREYENRIRRIEIKKQSDKELRSSIIKKRYS